ncbi:MAG: HD domain-containing protein [gamma proteobacterium symbiont of Bathyaustriella thionipta]|nr:HD domain-containing protein [gamma proteobacterium symbiont of Bathyaustriella thionipta]
MQIYKVGGCVRDELLGVPIKDTDWVVVGATAEQMLALGYQQVGKDFPVFLHPQTHEEYALARAERNHACSTPVTLEQDLSRRDLSINAMAQTAEGQIIDPHQGQADLKNRWLRHVSDAFADDPIRVLRLARLAARLSPFGFKVADETRQLIAAMLKRGELNHLLAERGWQELKQALSDPYPRVFIETLQDQNVLAVVFPPIHALFGVPQPARYHPEIDAGVHTLMVLDQACQLSTDPQVRLAALLHDFGKATTPQAEWPRHIAHESRGLPVIKDFPDYP